MSGAPVRQRVSHAADTVIAFFADATHSFPLALPLGKMLPSAALAALFGLVASPIDMPSLMATSTLRCYDSFGHREACLTQADAARPRLEGRTSGPSQPASSTPTAPSQPASWAMAAPYRQPVWAAAVDPAMWPPSQPAAPRSTPKRSASAACRRNVLPCFLSTLGRGISNIASAVAHAGASPEASRGS